MGRDQGRTSDILEAVALLVVDMQEAFLNTIVEGESVLRRCTFAIEAARTLGIRVLFTEQVPEKLGPTLPALREAAPDARMFLKNTFSALGANGLVEHLRKTGVYHLLIAGIETPVCVYQTALHAQDSDFDVTILSDCVGARRPDDARIVLQALAGASCHVLPAETVYYSMLGNSAHRVFPAYTELVKLHGGDTPAASAKPAKSRSRKTRAKAHDEPPTIAPPEPAEVLVPSSEPESKTPRASETGRVSGESDADRPPGFTREPEEHSDDWEEPIDEEESAAAPSDTSSEHEPARKRPRRRRGGARRRRARERAATETASAGRDSSTTGEPWTAPEQHGQHRPSPSETNPQPES
ncbi:MAG: isochorismatase family protein [Opitutaceae bacterium]